MSNTHLLREQGQSIWLDTITRPMLDSGILRTLIDQLDVTGLTSNPTIFERALREGDAYVGDIAGQPAAVSAEELFTSLALADLRRAAALLQPVFESSDGQDGWVSMEISPELSCDTAGSLAAARQLHEQAACSNLLVKIPGTAEGIAAIEAAIFEGIPVNVTLLFSTQHYLAAAQAYLRGIERRIAAGLDPRVASVASMFVSRWDQVVQPAPTANGGTAGQTSTAHDSLGVAMAQCTYFAHLQLLQSPRWQALAAAGARPQRLLWASTGTKSPALSDVFYVESLIAPQTINTLPEATLRAFADHGQATQLMAVDGQAGEATIARLLGAGIDPEPLALQLQRDGVQAFVASWRALLQGIESKR
jgi:transaldolase